MHYLANARRRDMQEFVKLKVRYDLVIQIENQLQLIFYALRYAEILCRVDREADLIGNQTEETNFFFVVGIGIKPA